MPPYADDIRREMWTGDDVIVPMDAAKRVVAVGYLLEEDGDLLITVAPRHRDQFTNGAGR